jgi:hypothetical protein
MNCRPGCGACCIAPSISSLIPGMPTGKPAGVRCAQLTAKNRCLIFGRPERPGVFLRLRPSPEMCGGSAAEAMAWFTEMEWATKPVAKSVDNSSQRVFTVRKNGSGLNAGDCKHT